jgi:Membrane bound O-acyl transferase family
MRTLVETPPWAVMWVTCFTMFLVTKAAAVSRVPGRHRISRLFAFIFLWVGMDAAEFLSGAKLRSPGGSMNWLPPFLRWLAGCALLRASLHLGAAHPLVAGWLVVLSGILALHFGAFDLLALAWRRIGVHAEPLMDAPWRAGSISEFWGRRWNRSFHRLVVSFVFKPVARRFGPRAAMWAGFAASGVVHDLAISFPARGGWGLPTVYFLIQALGMECERTRRRRRQVPTLLWVLLPAPILFHPRFLGTVMLPFAGAVGASLRFLQP